MIFLTQVDVTWSKLYISVTESLSIVYLGKISSPGSGWGHLARLSGLLSLSDFKEKVEKSVSNKEVANKTELSTFLVSCPSKY